MPITFSSVDDPFGIRSAGSALGQALFQRGLENTHNTRLLEQEGRQDNRQIAAEERALNRQLSQEKRQLEMRQLYGTELGNALKVVQDPNVPLMQKIGALQQYAALSGDSKGISPILNQLIKQGDRESQNAANLAFFRQLGVDIPEGIDLSNISPSAITTGAQLTKPTFEPEGDKIEAKRSADFADKIVKDYQGAEAAKPRLMQMNVAAKSDILPTPLMYKTMEFLGVPLSVFADPTAEAYDKNVNEYIKDISNFFPGQIRVAEIEPYMKTIPTLLNSDEGKQLIIQNQMLINDAKIANYEAYKQILKENNGRKPRNLDIEILERTKEKRNENAEKLKNNFEEAILISKYPTGKVKKGTFLTPNIAFNYLQRAKGDREKAMQQAREDGYEF